MEDQELHDLIQKTSKETAHAMRDEIREQVDEGVTDALTRVGIDSGDPIETQQDLSFLRDWRRTTKDVRRKGIITAVGLVAAGLCGAVWIGLKDLLS